MPVIHYHCRSSRDKLRYDTKNQLKTIQKIEHDLAYMDYAMIFLSIVLLLISITGYAHAALTRPPTVTSVLLCGTAKPRRWL